MTGDRFDCEIQARFRDVNLGGHVDNIEAMRILDEARIQFFRFAAVHEAGTEPGLLRGLPSGVTELVGAQRVDYHAEMRFAPYRPFLVRLWVSRIGRTSFTTASEMRLEADHPPALIAETVSVCWDQGQQVAWPLTTEVVADLERFSGPAVGLRGD